LLGSPKCFWHRLGHLVTIHISICKNATSAKLVVANSKIHWRNMFLVLRVFVNRVNMAVVRMRRWDYKRYA
jgi:hypothetical protein